MTGEPQRHACLYLLSTWIKIHSALFGVEFNIYVRLILFHRDLPASASRAKIKGLAQFTRFLYGH